jgi:hypothetical protein
MPRACHRSHPAEDHEPSGLDGRGDRPRIAPPAALSRSPLPQGPVLLAEVDGDPVAAIGIFDGRPVADPARSTFAQRRRLELERLFLRVVIAIGGV